MSIAIKAWRKDQFSESGKVGVEMEIRDGAAAGKPEPSGRQCFLL